MRKEGGEDCSGVCGVGVFVYYLPLEPSFPAAKQRQINTSVRAQGKSGLRATLRAISFISPITNDRNSPLHDNITYSITSIGPKISSYSFSL